MSSFKQQLESSTSLQPPQAKAGKGAFFDTMVLPSIEENFAVPHDRNGHIALQPVSFSEWQRADMNGMLLNFPSQLFAMSHVKKLEALGAHYEEALDPHTHEWQRSFAIIENPQKKGEFHLYEIPYQYFDADKHNGKTVEDSTGFKMSAAVEHVLPNHSKAEAEAIIERINTFPGVNIPRDLVKDAHGKVAVNMAFGGWTLEVGGGYNAYEIELGGYPLQWKNLLGIDGKPHALEEALASLKKMGVELEPKDGKPGATIEITGDSMGTPNAQLAKYLLETHYGQKNVPCMNMVPMAQGQALKQLTEVTYNLKHKSDHFIHLKELNPAQQLEAEKIAYAIHDADNQTTVFASNNYFAYYNVNGNSRINSAPGLPGDRMLLVKPDERQWNSAPKDSYLDQGFRIKSDHLLTPFNQKMMKGPGELSPAIYTPEHTLHDALFTNPKEAKSSIENALVESLHAFNIVMQQKTYGSLWVNQAADGKQQINQQPRKPITSMELKNALEHYNATPAQDITIQLTAPEVTTLHYLQAQNPKAQISR